ncbi:NAD-dependent deacetylase sirtuin-4-like protein [Euroglyphus maynei]|uniref:NAD-dependent deacetylase sirtuin-4-like protein n=1 Tax=Euroglyphus maynei TaxID=6958 RepID=A0A1Y3AMB3_EURMA|nr:NAD-dependent deacetylase sirtuin-4-like protein [Euroglyphus maynei]
MWKNLLYLNFVPAFKTCTEKEVELLQNFIEKSRKLAVITGAGISTESGLPDYRSKDVGLYSRNGYRPMNYAEFLRHHCSRQRYWARSFLGWNYVHNRRPNISHLTLTDWQRSKKMAAIVTQNVDRLHHKAGTESVLELHGNLYNVKCVQCDHRISRILFQTVLTQMNNDLLNDESLQAGGTAIRPDGDIDVIDDFIHSFRFPCCERCGGILKPDIVFFGDNVEQQLVQRVYQQLNECDSLIVLGSSLKVFSIFRFILHAIQYCAMPLAIVNIGPTRADTLKGGNILKIDSKISHVITKI